MKRAYLVSAASILLGAPALFAGCNPEQLVVVENDGGTKGNTDDAGTKSNGDDGGTKSNGDDGGTKSNGDAGGTGDGGVTNSDGGVTTSDGGACAPTGVTFQLTVGTTDEVWYGGSTPPWPAASFGCPGWLTITAPAGSPLGNSQVESVNLGANDCTALCPAAQPSAPAPQSFTWDGTYYPPTSALHCDTPVCAPPGVYGATMCVGYDGADAGPGGAPTCQSFSFTWPPASPADAIVQTTITPTPGGG
jgi:hypothetical protein